MPWFVTYERNGETCHEIDHIGQRQVKATRLRSNERRVRITEAEARMRIDDLAEALADSAGGLGHA